MHHRIIAQQLRLHATPFGRNISKAAALVEWVYALENELDVSPKLYQIEREHTVWINFERSSLDCAWFFEEYAGIAAFVSQQYPVWAMGTVRGKESAEIEIRCCEQDNMLEITKSNISGENFASFTDLCLRVQMDDADERQEMVSLLSNLSAHQSYLAVHRCPLTKVWFAAYPDWEPYPFYQYLPLPGGNTDTREFWRDTTVEQRKELWLQLLREQASMPEFEYVLDALRQDNLTDFFQWELALRQALSEANVDISFLQGEFRMTDSAGKRLLFSYANGTAAERLLLKIIFPVAPGRR